MIWSSWCHYCGKLAGEPCRYPIRSPAACEEQHEKRRQAAHARFEKAVAAIFNAAFNELRPIPPSDAVGGERDSHSFKNGDKSMPGIHSRVVSPPAPARVPANGYYPKLLQGQPKRDGSGGSVWLVTAPKTGTIVQLASRPQKTKHRLGYYTTRLKEEAMVVFKGKVELDGSAQAA